MLLPKYWSESDKGSNIKIGDDKLSLVLENTLEEAEFVRTSNPIPSRCLHFYFEIQILCDKGSDGISIGITTTNSSLSHEPSEQIFSPEVSYSLGNTVGFFIDFKEGFTFLTLDGKIVGEFNPFSGPPDKCYPTVRLRSAGAIVTATFNAKKCRFNSKGNKL